MLIAHEDLPPLTLPGTEPASPLPMATAADLGFEMAADPPGPPKR
jgi:hypothetical protein